MSAIAQFREVTADAPGGLQRRLGIKTRLSNRPADVAPLSKTRRYYAALEEGRYGALFGSALADFPARRKLPLIAEHLRVPGLNPLALHCRPLCKTLPVCGDSAESFGCICVMAGATLGGRTLPPRVDERLDCGATRGAPFLTSYADQVGEMRQRFSRTLEAECTTAQSRDRACPATVSTCVTLENGLCGEEATARNEWG